MASVAATTGAPNSVPAKLTNGSVQTKKRQLTRRNPVTGENVNTYKYYVDEQKVNRRQRDISSPVTGSGSRGQLYKVSVEERKIAPRNTARDSTCRAISERNVLTGENCTYFQVCQEMRSERRRSASIGASSYRATTSYNIITGDSY